MACVRKKSSTLFVRPCFSAITSSLTRIPELTTCTDRVPLPSLWLLQPETTGSACRRCRRTRPFAFAAFARHDTPSPGPLGVCAVAAWGCRSCFPSGDGGDQPVQGRGPLTFGRGAGGSRELGTDCGTGRFECGRRSEDGCDAEEIAKAGSARRGRAGTGRDGYGRVKEISFARGVNSLSYRGESKELTKL